jgi:hypothetical protein
MSSYGEALLLSIAVDTTKAGGGFRGPFEQDGKYEYIPVPEYKTESDEKTFKCYLEGEPGEQIYGKDFGNRRSTPLINSMPETYKRKLVDIAIHHDPNFRHKTYGDGVIKTRRGQKVATLNPGDLLVFCPSLENYDTQDRGRFIIGYFVVEHLYDFSARDFEKEYGRSRKEIVEEYEDKNAHFSKAFARAWDCDDRNELLDSYLGQKADLVLVTGKPDQGGLFEKAIRLTEPYKGEYYFMRREIVRSLGLAGSPYRLRFGRGWKHVDSNHVKELSNLFQKEGGGLH